MKFTCNLFLFTHVLRLQQTSILTNPALRKRHETVEMALMPFVAETEMRDLASDEQAKETWKRVRGNNMELPCILVDGKRVGVRSHSLGPLGAWWTPFGLVAGAYSFLRWAVHRRAARR